MSERDLLQRAVHFAVQAHKRIDQRRKYTHQPYEVHLKAVAEIVASVTDDPEIIAAAWLHDTVEDTPATFQDVEREFGSRVAGLVLELTDVSRPSDGNRSARKAIDRAHLASASAEAKTVKLADLIDNCSDICRHDPSFARVFLIEAHMLLRVLHEGDPTLHRRARKVVGDCAAKLGIEIPEAHLLPWPEEDEPLVRQLRHRGVIRMFTAAFTAKDIAEPLYSFDADRIGPAVAERMRSTGLHVVGIRIDGAVRGYVRGEDLNRNPPDPTPRPFGRGQILHGEDSLADVIQVLTRHEHCFVTTLGGIDGVISRAEIQSPIVRMWLFGIITFVEMDLADRIRVGLPGTSWVSRVTPARLSKAEALFEERRRRGQPCELLDCLQFSDKAQVLLEEADQIADFGFPSKAAAKRVIRELESLRNNLAHSQDIVTHDWSQIARLAQQIHALAAGPEPRSDAPGGAAGDSNDPLSALE